MKEIPFEIVIPSTDAELTKREIYMFLILKKLRYDLSGDDSIMLQDDHKISEKLKEF